MLQSKHEMTVDWVPVAAVVCKIIIPLVDILILPRMYLELGEKDNVILKDCVNHLDMGIST